MVAAHVFVDDLDDAVIAEEDRHHLERVLRLRPGEVVSVSDGAGGVRDCVLRDGCVLEPAGDVRRADEPHPRLCVGFALVKGDRPEWIVQKLTEVGVDRIVPFTSARSVVKWHGERSARNVERLRKVAREAAMQSRRVWLPVVDGVSVFGEPLVGDGSVALASIDGDAPTLATPTVLVGPEGGWTADELAAAPAQVRLGPTVLRAETAAVAAGVLLAALRDGIVTAERGRSPR